MSEDLDLTPTQVLLRPSAAEHKAWLELAKANDMSLTEAIRYALCNAAGYPDLYDQIKAAQKIAKTQRGRKMQAKRWEGHTKGQKAEGAELDAPFGTEPAAAPEELLLDEPYAEH